MRFSSLFPLILASLAMGASAAGCSSSAADTAPFEEGPGGGDSAPGIGILYEGESPLTLAPGERARLHFLVSPKGVHAVRFALTGDSGDASLDIDFTSTAKDGRVSVELTAPSSARTFTVRASLDSGSGAEVPVSVSGIGFGKIEVVPSYSGKRTVTKWTATVTTGTSCAELSGLPPPDGPLVGTASAKAHPIIKGAPVGPPLVVTVRAGHFAGGCADVKGLGAFETKRVSITLLDRPIDLSKNALSLSLTLDPPTTELEKLFDEARESTALAFAPSPEAAGLLDSMAAALPASLRPGFDGARDASEWDDIVATYFAAKDLSLYELADGWLRQAAESLDLRAGMSGRIVPASAKGAASYEPTSLFGVDATRGDMAVAPVSWSASPGDVVQIGGAFAFSPTALLAESIELETPVKEALVAAVDCEELASELAGASSWAECEADCLASACTEALGILWSRATHEAGASANLATWTVTASGDAKVGDEAELIGFDGSWVGSIEQSEKACSLKGRAVGSL